MTDDDTIRSLRAALQASPDNVPLRRHLAEVLLGRGRGEDAEQEFRQALKLAPDDVDVRIGLVRAYRAQGKDSAADVVLDDMIAQGIGSPRARIERTRALLGRGHVEAAVREYRKALDEDPSAADEELGERLGVRADTDPWSEVVEGRERMSTGDGEREARMAGIEPVQSDVDFAKVGGMDDLKEEIRRKIIHPLKHPEVYRAYGKKVGGGILLYGPPGCGKTWLAKATAGEIEAGFLSIGIHEVLDMWIGQSERNLHAVFETARQNRPCVLFFDEVDALGASRGDLRASAGRQTINQFLAELDGLQSDNEGLLVLAATNAPWHMDSAFRRPGRFDRVLFVPPPDAEARAEILRVLLRDKPQQDIDHAAVARKTDAFSGADLGAVVDRAIEQKLERAMATGTPEPLTTKDLLAAARKHRPTTREWFHTARNYVLYANAGGLYDDLKAYLKL